MHSLSQQHLLYLSPTRCSHTTPIDSSLGDGAGRVDGIDKTFTPFSNANTVALATHTF